MQLTEVGKFQVAKRTGILPILVSECNEANRLIAVSCPERSEGWVLVQRSAKPKNSKFESQSLLSVICEAGSILGASYLIINL